MDHNAHHDAHPTETKSNAGIVAVIFLSFAPCALTLLWVLHLSRGGI